ncbi:MAG: DUF3574 domain-containing protein [Micropepsaceae bacterium]
MNVLKPGAALLAAALAACATPKAAPPSSACAAGASSMARVELIFGLDIKGGGRISEDEWRAFLEKEVTPRFPDGLTAFDAYGQWRVPADGRIARLDSKVLLIWYAPSAAAEASIQSVREAYKARYDQISVMRVDGADCVSF